MRCFMQGPQFAGNPRTHTPHPAPRTSGEDRRDLRQNNTKVQSGTQHNSTNTCNSWTIVHPFSGTHTHTFTLSPSIDLLGNTIVNSRLVPTCVNNCVMYTMLRF